MNARVSLYWVAAMAALTIACSKSPSAGTCQNNLKSDGKGNCVECVSTADCTSAGTYCSAGVCAACTEGVAECQSAKCRGNDDCASGKYCATDGSCQDGCRGDDECEPGKICSPTAHACVPGCSEAHACAKSSETCCDGTCVNTKTSTSSCGGCGMACDIGNQCCGGTCADTQNDPAHCGGCNKPACPGSDPCVDGQCQSASAALVMIDARGLAPIDSTSTDTRVLQAHVILQQGLPSVQGCLAERFDGPGTDVDAGIVTMKGYTGGATINSGPPVDSNIQCDRENGRYRCGYGAITDSKVGADLSTVFFDPTANPIGAGNLSYSGSGGAGFGTFDVSATAGGEIATTTDLTTINYDGSAAVTIPVSCAGGAGCSLLQHGIPVVIVEASSNEAADFGKPATAGGRMLCFPSALSLTVANITIDQASIQTMLGSKNDIKTIRTTLALASVPPGAATGNFPKDADGRYIVPTAGRGVFGFVTK
jgi:hypothetical protein